MPNSPESDTKVCTKCQATKPEARFAIVRNGKRRNVCEDCRNTARKERESSDFVPLVAEDFHSGVSGNGAIYGADAEKKQEFNKKMGRVAKMLARPEGVPEEEQEELAVYLARLGEEESRYTNRQLFRSVAIGAARDRLFIRQFEQMSARVSWKAPPSGYAIKRGVPDVRRMATLHLSDLHVGASLEAASSPEPFDFLTASRRLGKLIAETCSFKTQYRDNTELNLLFNGDVVEGLLGWDQADQFPLTEQMVAFTRFAVDAIVQVSRAYPKVNCHFQTGNHGRNKLRHQGRATTQKWDSTEHALYKFIADRVSLLPNVTCHIPKAPISVVPLFDHNMLMTHGDTELKLASPSSAANTNDQALADVNSSLVYGKRFSVLTFGHFHDPKAWPSERTEGGWIIANGCLVPSNGHGRTAGHARARCGQYLWESTPKYPVGEVRFLDVGRRDDENADLDNIIQPFVFDEVHVPVAA